MGSVAGVAAAAVLQTLCVSPGSLTSPALVRVSSAISASGAGVVRSATPFKVRRSAGVRELLAMDQ